MNETSFPSVDDVATVTAPRRFPICAAVVIEDGIMFDATLHIHGETVTIYPPDVVVVKRVINGGLHCICRYAGGPLCVIATKHLEPSPVKLS